MSRLGLGSSADEKSRFTASDSLASKYWAHKLKYINDPFVEVVFERITKTNPAGLNVNRRSPIINRGYYARIESMNRVLYAFLESTNGLNRQILCLGSGYDTFSLLPYSKGHKKLRTFEVDFQEIITKKAEILLTEPAIADVLLSPTVEGCEESQHSLVSESILQVGPISLIAQDLRHADKIIADLLQAGFDPTQPTFILTECVLVYVQKEQVTNLCQGLADLLQSTAVWATYDMINPHDQFGKTMHKNLQQHGFYIPGFAEFPTLEAQQNRFLDNHWSLCRSSTMLAFFNRNVFNKLSEDEKKELLKIEIFDEFEEWNILMDHYSMTIAMKQSSIDDTDTASAASVGRVPVCKETELFAILNDMFA